MKKNTLLLMIAGIVSGLTSGFGLAQETAFQTKTYLECQMHLPAPQSKTAPASYTIFLRIDPTNNRKMVVGKLIINGMLTATHEYIGDRIFSDEKTMAAVLPKLAKPIKELGITAPIKKIHYYAVQSMNNQALNAEITEFFGEDDVALGKAYLTRGTVYKCD